jgi:HAE1 family hydrophobic/amphiphilic exporter-1
MAIANPSFTWRNQGGGGSSIDISLMGKSSEKLAEISKDVAWTLSQLPGFSDVRSDAEIGEKEVQITVDRQRARQYGFSAGEIAQVISAALRGVNLRKMHGESGEIDIRLEFQEEDRETLDQLKDLPLHSRTGTTVKLASLANFKVRRGPRSIQREDRTTSLGVSANLTDVTKGDAQKMISFVLANYNFPAGYTWNFGQSFDHEQEAMNTMLINLLLALALIYFVMASLFESLLYPTAIWTQILFSIVGVYWFFLITGTTMSIMAMIGILILIGVVVNNGIVLVDHINHLRSKGMKRNEAIVQAGRDRLRPILMTAGTTVLSLVPLCVVTTQIGGNGPPYFPMARSIVGGLTFSTMITLLVLPTIYAQLDDLRNWSRRVIAKAKGAQPAAPDESERRLSI